MTSNVGIFGVSKCCGHSWIHLATIGCDCKKSVVGIYIHLPRIYLHFLPHGAQCVPRTLIESTLRDVSALGDQPRTLWQCYSSAVLQTYVEGAWGQAGRRTLARQVW